MSLKHLEAFLEDVENDKIPGGKSDKVSIKDIADKHSVNIEVIEKQIKMGLKVEMEHTTDKDIAREITMDHLMESPSYYTDLEKMEKDY